MRKISLLASPQKFDYWLKRFESVNDSIALTPSKKIETCDLVIIHTSFWETDPKLYEEIMSNNSIRKILFGGSKKIDHSLERNMITSDDIFIISLVSFL